MSDAIDRNALKIDLPKSKAAWDDLATLMRSVSAYVTGLEQLDVSPVSVFQTTVDLFYNLPELRTILLAARANGAGWTNVGNALYQSTLLKIVEFGSSLKGATAEISGIVQTATDAHRALTNDERTRILVLLRWLQSSLASSTTEIDRQRPAIVDFLRKITTDSAPLKSGAHDLGKAIATVQTNTANEASKYVLDPLSRGIYTAIVELGGKILQRMQDLQNTLAPLSRANDHVLEAVQGMLTIWATLKEKFTTVIDVLATIETSVDTFSTLPDLLAIAAESWQELSDYVLKSPSETAA